jgi:thiocyanate hydrolase subunit alpha
VNTKYKIGDKVTIRDDITSLFHTRTQAFTRGHTGVVTEFRPVWVVPEDEAFGRIDDGRKEQFYVVRFKQKELWPDYTGFDVDTLETEVAEGWMVPAGKEA